MADHERALADAHAVNHIIDVVRHIDLANMLDFYKELRPRDAQQVVEVLSSLQDFELTVIRIYFSRLTSPFPGQGDPDDVATLPLWDPGRPPS